MTRDNTVPEVGFIDIEYKHSNRTAGLVASGWLTGGREYAVGADGLTPLTS